MPVKTLQSILVGGEFGRQDFDGASPAQIQVVGEVDFPHAPRTQQGANFVATKSGALRDRHGRQERSMVRR